MGATMTDNPITSSQLALRLGVMPYCLRAIFDRGLIEDDFPRIGGIRIFRESQIPMIRELLIRHGYMSEPAEVEVNDRCQATAKG